MNVVIRTDASYEIGFGHVMRCLTLAESLRNLGVTVSFVIKKQLYDLKDHIENSGFDVYRLTHAVEGHPFDYEEDAIETINVISNCKVDLLIVDHYMIDIKWQSILRSYIHKIMVIDDLANRKHDCDFILDQNYISDINRYDSLTPSHSIKFLGGEFALLRKEFSQCRPSLYMRKINKVNNVLIQFGGSDPQNLTLLSLQSLVNNGFHINVVVGSAYMYLDDIQSLVNSDKNTMLYVQPNNIAKQMLVADIAIGAGGISTWERMCVGLPSIVITTAENQISFNNELHRDGYINLIGESSNIKKRHIYESFKSLIDNTELLYKQSKKCLDLIDGLGSDKIAKILIDIV